MKEIVSAAITSAVIATVVSVICCNISGMVIYRIINKHVDEIISMAKKSMKDTRDTFVKEIERRCNGK